MFCGPTFIVLKACVGATLYCRLVLEAQRCYTEVLSSAVCDNAIPVNSEMQKGIMVANFSINFVCRQNVAGTNCNLHFSL